jgi:hypothetical protein
MNRPIVRLSGRQVPDSLRGPIARQGHRPSYPQISPPSSRSRWAA